MKNIIKSSFYQLIVVYVILIALVSFKLIFKYNLHFELFALILALFSLFLIKQKESKINKTLLIISIILILFIRVLPYLNNSISLGYDPGIYKYAIEGNTDKWISSVFEPLFLNFTSFLKTILTIDQILIQLFIFLSIILGLTIYITTKKFFDENIAILSTILYSISIIQFKLFSYFYYKNIIALILLLLTFYLIKSNNLIFILTASSLAGIHKPTFLIFALAFIIYTLIKKDKIKDK